jgi:hypothetical protein
MEGGVALFLLFLLLIVAVGGGIALYMTGGALIAKDGKDEEDGESAHRPLHERPTSPTQEKVELAGTHKDEQPDT